MLKALLCILMRGGHLKSRNSRICTTAKAQCMICFLKSSRRSVLRLDSVLYVDRQMIIKEEQPDVVVLTGDMVSGYAWV